jgi:hypothetical protein
VPDLDDEIAYAVLKDKNDPEQGWKNLNIKGTETAVDLGLKDNTVVAFALLDKDAVDDDVNFEVVWPSLDDEDEVAEE